MLATDLEIECLLRKIGKAIFIKILYPELTKDINITFEELANIYTDYASFTVNSQRTRLSSAKKIFVMNKQKEALENILLSEKISSEDKNLVHLYLKQLK